MIPTEKKEDDREGGIRPVEKQLGTGDSPSATNPKFRERLVQRAEELLCRRDLPRLHMFIIILATGMAGFLISFLLMKAGLIDMAIRYPVAIGMAYLVFFLLIKLWLHFQENDGHPHGDAGNVAGDVASDIVDGTLKMADHGGGGGHIFSGGGSSGGGSGFNGLDVLDADEGIFVIVGLVALLAALAACFFVIWTAPALLAEVLVDGVIMTRMCQKMKSLEPSHWVLGVLRRTWLISLVTMLSFGALGYALQKIEPKATSIGAVLARYFP